MRLLTRLFVLSLLLVMVAGCSNSGVGVVLRMFVPRIPLSDEAIASCPVTLPSDEASPVEIPPDYAGFTYWNEETTLFTIPWPEGKVIFEPGGPGFIGLDGSLAMKWPWYRYNVVGQLTIEGRRLDAPALPLRAEINGNYGTIGFQPSGLIFSSEGCWEVTGRVGDHSLTFVTLVIQVDE